MKKGIAITLGIVVCVGIAVMFFYEGNTAKSVTGKELFTDEFVESVISIHYRPFDESGVIAMNDKEKVEEFFEILRNETYKSIDEYHWVEGGYSFDFVTKDLEEIQISISGDIIVFGGGQRRAVSGKDLVQEIRAGSFAPEAWLSGTGAD